MATKVDKNINRKQEKNVFFSNFLLSLFIFFKFVHLEKVSRTKILTLLIYKV